jgi:hypothetical protein
MGWKENLMQVKKLESGHRPGHLYCLRMHEKVGAGKLGNLKVQMLVILLRTGKGQVEELCDKVGL